MLTACNDTDIVLIADPKILAIPVIENHAPWVNIINQNEIVIGPSPEIPNNTDYTQMRRIVYEKLLQAQSYLPEGLRFCLYEGYRSLTLQQQLFSVHYEDIKKLHPDWSHEDIFMETTKLVSPVMNVDGTKNIPPHSTGAAIDIYLLDADGNAIDMGIHPKDWMQDNDGSLSQTDSKKISNAAQKNRQIMNAALEKAGFANYPTEYWHWSYGDRYWAYQTKHDHALFDTRK